MIDLYDAVQDDRSDRSEWNEGDVADDAAEAFRWGFTADRGQTVNDPSAATRRYMAEDLTVRSHLMWLRGYLESSDPEIVPKLDMAIQREQELRDRYYDALDDLRATQEAS